LARRLTEKQKKEIIELFISGRSIEQLASKFDCTKLTISRNLKKNIGEKKYKEFINMERVPEEVFENKKQNNVYLKENKISNDITQDSEVNESITNNIENEDFSLTTFTEIIPLDYEIENSPQKDLTSVPISEVDFPNVVYMIVDKKIELETKYLKDYPQWDFLSQDELSRKTIEIYTDQKIAKRFCNKDQKVIKVPNTNVFKIVAPILISRGISRIVNSENLIAL
tara:strand:+ start:258 stop:935 length:678 start_codon:yes stop_codon:yes gene_type:complete